MNIIGNILCFVGGTFFGIISMSLLWISERETRWEEPQIEEMKKEDNQKCSI